jgi:small multidrug resistance family-3 protein
MFFVKTFLLFSLTALAEITGCYLPFLMIKEQKSWWLIVPTLISLSLFVWLLTLHPASAGRTYAAYGGVYVVMALIWLRLVDKVHLSVWDMVGSGIMLIGVGLIAFQPGIKV